MIERLKNIFMAINFDIKDYVNKQDHEQLCYIATYLFAISAICLKKALDVYTLGDYAIWPAGILFSLGFLSYLTKLYEKMNSKNIGKWLIALIVILATKFNFAIADQSINLIFEVPSKELTYTETFISILTLPFSISLILLFTFPVFMLISMIDSSFDLGALTLRNILTFNIRAIGENIRPSYLFGRMFAIAAITSFAIGFLQTTDKYIYSVENTIKAFTYNFELQNFSYCSLPKNSKNIMISDHLVYFAVKNKDGYDFKITRCIEKL